MTAQTEFVINELALDRGAWLINCLNVNYSAQRLEIDAEYEDKTLRLIFKEFHLLSWQIFEDEHDSRRFNVDVIGMEYGESHHHKPASITTDVFEIILTYSDLEIEKLW